MFSSIFQPGDVVERAGLLGTKHRAIFAGFDGAGRPWVIHNAKDDRVRWDLLEVFGAGFPVTVASRVATSFQAQQLIVARAKSLLGRKYHLLNFNCDHFVTYAAAGAASSPQLQMAVGLIGLAALVGLVVSSSA